MTAPQPWPTSRLCPATSNLPTRMLPGTWRTICASYQRREAVGANRQNGMTPEDFAAISAARFPCAMCGGRTLPPGLELITQQEAEQMARQTKRGICELCGAHTNVGMNHGSAACPACTHVQTALNKRPEAVAKAARAMHKTEELLGHLIPAGGLAVKVTADLLQEISGIVGYDGEDPAELVEAVRRRATGGAQQLTSEAEAGALRTIAGIVGYDGTDGAEVVESVRRRVLTCASCDAEDVLAEIREIVGYSPDMGDSGLADAVRASAAAVPAEQSDLDQQWIDLMRASGLEDDGGRKDWSWAVAAAIQEIARLEYRRDFWASKATRFKIEAGDLRSELLVKRGEIDELRNEIARLNGQTHSESEQVTALRTDLSRSSEVIEQLRAELALVEQAHDEWEQRAVQAESNVETLEAELQERDRDEGRSLSRLGLLDIAIAALRGDAVPADQIAGLLAIARKVSA